MANIDDFRMTEFNIPNRRFDEGFWVNPELIEWFGIQAEYLRIYISQSGDYWFKLRADDGAKLYIDDSKVVDNDGLHAVRDKKKKILPKLRAITP